MNYKEAWKELELKIVAGITELDKQHFHSKQLGDYVEEVLLLNRTRGVELVQEWMHNIEASIGRDR
jgi:hypothetical protein